MLVKLPGRSADLAIGPDGNLNVAVVVQGHWNLQKYAPDGTALGSWDIGAPRELDPGTMSVAPDGTVAILFGRQVFLLAPDGRRIGVWDNIWFVWETQIAFWGSDRLLATIPHRDSIAVFSRTGELITEFKNFTGGPGKFFAPVELRLHRRGRHGGAAAGRQGAALPHADRCVPADLRHASSPSARPRPASASTAPTGCWCPPAA